MLRATCVCLVKIVDVVYGQSRLASRPSRRTLPARRSTIIFANRAQHTLTGAPLAPTRNSCTAFAILVFPLIPICDGEGLPHLVAGDLERSAMIPRDHFPDLLGLPFAAVCHQLSLDGQKGTAANIAGVLGDDFDLRSSQATDF